MAEHQNLFLEKISLLDFHPYNHTVIVIVTGRQSLTQHMLPYNTQVSFFVLNVIAIVVNKSCKKQYFHNIIFRSKMYLSFMFPYILKSHEILRLFFSVRDISQKMEKIHLTFKPHKTAATETQSQWTRIRRTSSETTETQTSHSKLTSLPFPWRNEKRQEERKDR